MMFAELGDRAFDAAAIEVGQCNGNTNHKTPHTGAQSSYSSWRAVVHLTRVKFRIRRMVVAIEAGWSRIQRIRAMPAAPNETSPA